MKRWRRFRALLWDLRALWRSGPHGPYWNPHRRRDK
jgi:hypothetical protein